MWNTFIHQDETYIIKLSEDSTYRIILSNFVKIWIEELTSEEIVNRCKSLNPLITTDDDIYIIEALNFIKNIKLHQNSLNLIFNADDVTIICETKLADSPFKFNFLLKLSNSEDLSKELIIPMMQTIQYLEIRQKELCSLLEKKDNEIQQHIFENGGIKRESIITEKFNSKKFNENKSEKLCCNIFSESDEFNKNIIAKYGCSEPSLIIVKKEERRSVKRDIPLAKAIIKHKRPKQNQSNIKQE